MFEVTIYFAGAKTQWSGAVSEDEVIARRSVSYLWLARVWADNVIAPLDPARCGYVIRKDGETLAHRAIKS